MIRKIVSIGIMVIFWMLSSLSASAQELTYYTAVSNSNVRAAPTTNSQKIGFLKQGKRVRVAGKVAGGSWYRIQLPSGQTGYIFAKLLQKQGDDTETSEKPKLTGGPSPAPEDAFAYIVWPNDGDVIPGGDFLILFGLHNLGVAPANIEKQFTGHHHLLIDTDLPALDEEIPSDDNYVHFGRGQTEYLIQLPKGKHALQLLLGDHNHIPHTPPVMSEQITITVP